MSYILDALKRADRERGRSSVPDIHAQPLAAPDGRSDRPGRAWRWIGGVAGLAIGVLAASAWHRMSGDPIAAPAAPAAASAASPASPAAAQTLVAAAQPAARPAPATGVAPAPPAAIAVAPAPPAAIAVAPAPPPPTVAVAAVAPAPIPPFLPPQPAPSPITKAIAPASAAGANIALTLQQLPEPARRHLGALKLGGAIHSQRAADRLLIVDGQVVREGDTVAPGVVLEQIRPRSAIFRWQQYSVELAH